MMLLNLCADAPIAPSTEGFTLISIRPERLPDDAIQIYDCTQARQPGSQSVSQSTVRQPTARGSERQSSKAQETSPKAHWRRAGDYPPRLSMVLCAKRMDPRRIPAMIAAAHLFPGLDGLTTVLEVIPSATLQRTPPAASLSTWPRMQ